MEKHTGSTPNIPLTNETLEPAVKAGFEGAVKYPGVNQWSRLAATDRSSLIEQAKGEILGTGKFGDQQVSGR